MALAVVIAVSAVSCGSGSAEITPSAARELDAAVDDVRTAIHDDDWDRAAELLSTLRTTVVELTTTGAVTGDRALEINQAISTLAEQVERSIPTTRAPTTRAPTTTSTTTTSTTTTSTTTEKPRRDDKRDKKGKGNNGKGKGNNGKNDDDKGDDNKGDDD